MCGIWSRFDRNKISPEDLYYPVASLSHRGPDSYGWFLKDNVALVHTRLSIIDLQEGGQPLKSYDGKWMGIVNGELYDYKNIRSQLEAAGVSFKTKSDSEVLLNLYAHQGIDGLKNITGEFAFIFYNLQTKELIFGRDLNGVKPLYYDLTEKALTIASELKAISPEKPRISKLYMENYFSRIMVPPQSLLENVLHVIPGKIYKFNTVKGELKKIPYQTLPLNSKRDLRGPEALNAVRVALENSVKKRLVADVEVGLYLSGGIDSALVAALATNLGARPRAYTVSFADRDLDESKKAAQIAEHLGISHSIVEMNGKNFFDHLIQSIQAFEHPIANPHGAAKNLLAWHAAKDVKVVLTGDGADEWFGGYQYLRLQKIQDFFKRHPAFPETIKNSIVSREKGMALKHLDGDSLTKEKIVSSYFSGMFPALFGRVPKDRFYQFVTGENLNHSVSNIAESLHSLMVEDMAYSSGKFSLLDLNIWFGLRTDFLHYIVSNVGDRQEMSHSLEGRTPFLDKEVIEAAARLHPHELMSGLNEKSILKKLGGKYYPSEIAQRKKHAFLAPSKYLYLRNNREILASYIEVAKEAMPWLQWKNIDHLMSLESLGNKTPLANSIVYMKLTLFSIGVLYTKLREVSSKAKYKLPTSYEDLKAYECRS
jgi:asparagine synthase (glutamine-hydrolysing)